MPELRHFAAVCVGVADTNVADGIVADAGVVVVKGADINAGVNGVMAMQTAHCVAANDIVDNELPFSSIFFHLPPCSSPPTKAAITNSKSGMLPMPR